MATNGKHITTKCSRHKKRAADSGVKVELQALICKGLIMHINKEYEQAVNQFIPQAEKTANETVRIGYYRNHENWMAKWNQCFHAEMMRLTCEAGVRNF